MLVAHHDRLHRIAVGEFPEILDRTVERRNLLAEHFRLIQIEFLLQLFPQGLGEIGHLIKIPYSPAEPVEDLPCSVFGLAKALQFLFNFFRCHGQDIIFHSITLFSSVSPQRSRRSHPSAARRYTCRFEIEAIRL